MIDIIIAQGSSSEAEDIVRCLRTLYGTVAGEQALDRDFGLEPVATDLPEIAARPLITAEIVAKTAKYEPRATVLRVDFESDGNGGIKPKVVIGLGGD